MVSTRVSPSLSKRNHLCRSPFGPNVLASAALRALRQGQSGGHHQMVSMLCRAYTSAAWCDPIWCPAWGTVDGSCQVHFSHTHLTARSTAAGRFAAAAAAATASGRGGTPSIADAAVQCCGVVLRSAPKVDAAKALHLC